MEMTDTAVMTTMGTKISIADEGAMPSSMDDDVESIACFCMPAPIDVVT